MRKSYAHECAYIHLTLKERIALASRFEQFIVSTDEPNQEREFGLLVHGNSQTAAKTQTDLTRRFH